MLEQMRKQSQSTLVILLFGFIVFVFVFSFGAGSVGFRKGGCGRAGLMAEVNGEEIRDTDFQYYYDQALRQEIKRHQQGKPMTQEDKIGLRKQVLDGMIERALLIQAARGLGLHVTNQERNADIRKAFMGKDKSFDFKRYKYYVTRYLDTTPAVFEEAWRRRMLAERMAFIIQDTVRITDDELRQAYQTSETKINLDFVKIMPASFKRGINPTEAEIDKFANDHIDRVENFYKSHDSQYHKPKKAKVAHVFFTVRASYDTEQAKDKEEQAELTVDDLKKGEEFAAEAKQYSEDSDTKEKGGELPMLTKEAMVARWGTAFAEAAFALNEGKHSAVVKSDKGFHVIKCLEVVPAEDRKLDEVKHDIAGQILAQDKAEAEAGQQAAQILAGIKAGKKLAELVPDAPKESPKDPNALEVRATGLFSRMSGFVPSIGIDEDLARQAFALTKDHPFPDKPLEIDSPMEGKAFVVMVLAERHEADMPAFDKARQDMRRRLLAQHRNGQLAAWLNYKRRTAAIDVNKALLADVTPPGMKNRRR